MSLVWDHYPGKDEYLTALCLADHADHDGSHIFPSVARISKKTMQSERTIQRHLAAMRENGWLIEVKRASGVPGDTTTYRIPIERIPRNIDGRVSLCHPSTGDTDDIGRVTCEVKTGDTAMSPKQGLPVSKPLPTKAQRFALPPWIAEEAWKGFETMRTKIRKPMTDRAKAMIVLELAKLRAQGHDPIAVLAQSEVRAWASVYPIDTGKVTRSNAGEALKNWHAPKDDEEEQHAHQ